jgi:hypothetical protein
MAPLPGPGVPDDELDMGTARPPEPPPAAPDASAGHAPDEDDEPGPDSPPGHLSAAAPKRRGGARQVRVSGTARKDIAAKVGVMLAVPGHVWQARDPLCGGTFVRQAPAIADALTDLICESADLVAFFTGPGGGFMKYLTLATALQPVGVVVWAHHIAHSAGEPQSGPAGPDMAAYAA